MDIVVAYSNAQMDMKSDELIENYAPLVKRIAHHVLGRLPQSVLIDDLIQAGMIGLLEAAKNYDGSKGASFETYANIRIRGNMLDEVRKNDWVPRSVYRNSRMITQAVKVIENRYNRDARDVEVAAELGISLEDYHAMLKDSACSQLYGFDDVGVTDDVLDIESVNNKQEPLADVQREDLHDHLVKIIDVLPERERLVLSLYYDQELNLKEIGEVLNVSESRVCQIHSQAMHRIKARLPDWKKSES